MGDDPAARIAALAGEFTLVDGQDMAAVGTGVETMQRHRPGLGGGIDETGQAQIIEPVAPE